MTEDKHSYCFFKFLTSIDQDSPLSVQQISRLTGMSEAMVEKSIALAEARLPLMTAKENALTQRKK